MEFGMSCRIKRKRNMKEIGVVCRKKIVELRCVFEFSRLKVAQIGPSRC